MLKLTHLNKSYENHKVLDDINVVFPKNKTTVILGPSGAGKSTLLRSINLLDQPESGSIELDNLKLNYESNLSNSEILQLRRKSAMVFQSWSLFPHMTIMENIIEGPTQAKNENKEQAIEEGKKLLAEVGLAGFENRYPSELSGGQQQRVSIARALALKPSYILFDEPTSALDPELEAQILHLIQKLAMEDKSMIVVTHNMDFARKVADKVIFLENGQVIFDGESKEFFENKNRRIQDFLKAMKF